jgi:hypothetical protein
MGVSGEEQKGNILCEAAMEARSTMPNSLEELRALEREVEREWWWLNGALHAVAQAQAEGLTYGLSQMQAQKRSIDRKRVEIAARIAALVGPPREGLNPMHGNLPEMPAPEGLCA